MMEKSSVPWRPAGQFLTSLGRRRERSTNMSECLQNTPPLPGRSLVVEQQYLPQKQSNKSGGGPSPSLSARDFYPLTRER
jgi:hypothetical protein